MTSLRIGSCITAFQLHFARMCLVCPGDLNTDKTVLAMISRTSHLFVALAALL